MTRRMLHAAALVATLALVLGPSPAIGQPADLPATVSTIVGPVEILPPGATSWISAKLRAEVDAGGSMRIVGAGRSALRTPSGHSLRVGSFSGVQLLAAAAGEADAPMRVKLVAGRLWVAVSPVAGPRPRVAVEAGPVKVSVRGSGVSLRMDREGSVLVRVYHGAALCAGTGTGPAWEHPLKGGEELVVPTTGVPGSPRALTREQDENIWVRWNEEQDAAGYSGPPPK